MATKIKNPNKKYKKITLMVPCYNEERGIPKVIQGVRVKELEEKGYKIEILVINNNSSDKTAEIAKKLGARVVDEPNPGY